MQAFLQQSVQATDSGMCTHVLLKPLVDKKINSFDNQLFQSFQLLTKHECQIFAGQVPFSISYHCKLTIFGFYTLGQEKKSNLKMQTMVKRNYLQFSDN